MNFSNIKRVLVTKMRFHGDVLLSSPVFQSLKKHYPHLEVDALIYDETREMLSLNPAVDKIFTVNRKWKKEGVWNYFVHERKLLKQLAERRYDVIIHLTENWRGLALKYLLRIPYAVTAEYPRREKSKVWKHCFSHIYPVPEGRDMVATHVDAVRILGITASEDEEQTAFVVSPQDQEYVKQLLWQNGLSRGAYILIHPTSRFFYKCWPPAMMASYIGRLQEAGFEIVVTAAPSPKEADYINQMVDLISAPLVNLSGQLSLKQLGAAIEQSAAFVGVDSAPMHMAAAVDVPIIALFGPTNIRVWSPKSKQATVLQSGPSSKPALVDGSRPNQIENCTLDIDVDLVFQATLDRLDGKGLTSCQ